MLWTWLIGGILCVVVALQAVQCVRLWRANTRLREQHEYQHVALRLHDWVWWWSYNTAETPIAPDRARSDFARFTFAALLAPDLDTLQRDLQRIAADEQRPATERQNAMLFATELGAAEPPWVFQNRQNPGAPLHNAHLVRAGYRALLDGWGAFLPSDGPDGSQSNSPDAPNATH